MVTTARGASTLSTCAIPCSKEIPVAGETEPGRRGISWALALAIVAVAAQMASGLARAADPCDGSTWNVAHERAVFATPPVSITAANAAGPSPTLALDKLYDIALTPQD